MKCWKCGQENVDGAGKCVYCGADQKRSAPSDAAGRAMRQLYDRYGAETVLTREQYLVNGLGDLLEDSRMLRNQIKAGLDAGIGKMYLEQIQGYGAPDALFNGRVKRVLTENIGFSEKAAGE